MSHRLVLLAAAVAAAAAPGVAQAESLTIEVVSVVVSLVPQDKKPAGTSKGDRIVYRDTLVNAVAQFGKKKGAKVGTDDGVLTFTSSSTARFDGTARLPGGTLRLSGKVTPLGNSTIRIPVVSGTGRFAAAKGTLTVGPGDQAALNTYRLKLPGGTVA